MLGNVGREKGNQFLGSTLRTSCCAGKPCMEMSDQKTTHRGIDFLHFWRPPLSFSGPYILETAASTGGGWLTQAARFGRGLGFESRPLAQVTASLVLPGIHANRPVACGPYKWGQWLSAEDAWFSFFKGTQNPCSLQVWVHTLMRAFCGARPGKSSPSVLVVDDNIEGKKLKVTRCV